MTKINDGITVQIISIVVPCTTNLLGEFKFSFEFLKKYKVLAIMIRTKKNIKVIKNIRS